jgi:hypothetical protein
MLKRHVLFPVAAILWASSASAQHERPYEFDDTHVAISIERFMGIDYVDPEGPGGSDVHARLLLNASEPVPTSLARLGVDVFIERFSIGLAGGVTSDDVAVVAARLGYLTGLSSTVGLWLRVGGFYASAGAEPSPSYAGLTGEVLLAWFPYPALAFHLGPTLDLAFAEDPAPNYLALGIPEVGMTAWF